MSNHSRLAKASPSLASPPLLEREAALEAIERFCAQCLIHRRGLLQISGPHGAGHSRLLAQLANAHPLDDAVVLLLPQHWPDAAPVDDTTLQQLIHQRVADAQDAQLLLLGIDDYDTLDRAVQTVFQRLLHDTSLPFAIAVIITLPGEAVAEPLTTTFHERMKLLPLSNSGLRDWLYVALGESPEPELVRWLYQETGGFPARIQLGLTTLLERGLLLRTPNGWWVAPTLSSASLDTMLRGIGTG